MCAQGSGGRHAESKSECGKCIGYVSCCLRSNIHLRSERPGCLDATRRVQTNKMITILEEGKQSSIAQTSGCHLRHVLCFLCVLRYVMLGERNRCSAVYIQVSKVKCVQLSVSMNRKKSCVLLFDGSSRVGSIGQWLMPSDATASAAGPEAVTYLASAPRK